MRSVVKGKGREGKGDGKTKYGLDGAEDERSISLSIQSAASVYSLLDQISNN